MFVLVFFQEGEAGEKREEGEKTEGERREEKGERKRKGKGEREREGQRGGVGWIYWDQLNQILEALFPQITMAGDWNVSAELFIHSCYYSTFM